jgi:hypothetical protein
MCFGRYKYFLHLVQNKELNHIVDVRHVGNGEESFGSFVGDRFEFLLETFIDN